VVLYESAKHLLVVLLQDCRLKEKAHFIHPNLPFAPKMRTQNGRHTVIHFLLNVLTHAVAAETVLACVEHVEEIKVQLLQTDRTLARLKTECKESVGFFLLY
jgi:hypothetical protein